MNPADAVSLLRTKGRGHWGVVGTRIAIMTHDSIRMRSETLLPFTR